MAVAGLYKRILPSPPAIEFASSEGKHLFSEALDNGTMEGFFKLISYFQTQSEPAYCGLASLSVVLNALAIDPGRKWKGPWRWFDESMLDCCEPLEKVKAEGITFGKVACLAHCAGAKVEAYHTSQSSVDEFRQHVIKCTSSDECHIITSYHRRAFSQTGTGHFSPIGGYHAGRDMALILDVARFKYPPHWVPLPLLWEAMNTIDDSTTLPRGFMLISRLPRAPLLYTLSCRHESWVKMATYLTDEVPNLIKLDSIESVQSVLSTLFRSLPDSAGHFIKWVVEVRRQDEGRPTLSPEEKDRLALKEEVLHQLRETKLFHFVKQFLHCEKKPCSANPESSNNRDSLPEIAATACCEGAALLTGAHGMMRDFCCKETCVKCVKSNGGEVGHNSTIVSGTVVSCGNNNEQGVDLLVPVSTTKPSCCGSTGSNLSNNNNCIVKYPASNDVLTVLLLALPPNTWSDIKDEGVRAEMLDLVSTDKLPDVIQWEVLHLRKQLLFLRYEDNESSVNPTLPSLQ